MPVVFDSSILLPLLSPGVGAPTDPSTNRPVHSFSERLTHLFSLLEIAGTKVIVPTPALSEILVRSGTAGPEYLDIINSSAAFRIAAFEERAAVEVAAMAQKALAAGDKRAGIDAPWTKIKYDRQIVAIAKVESASALYSDDSDIRTIGAAAGLTIISSWELPLPPIEPQIPLDLDE
jgi:hypothetical protein